MPRIEDYALLGDLHPAALVSTAGSVDWLCLPRFDSPAAFAALLHNREAGHWTLAPAGAGQVHARRYSGNALVLETDWSDRRTAPCGSSTSCRPGCDTPHLIRIAEGLSGEVAMRSTLRLRFDYGRVVPWVRRLGTQVHAIAEPDRVRLMSAVPCTAMTGIRSRTSGARGRRVPFVMSWAPGQRARRWRRWTPSRLCPRRRSSGPSGLDHAAYQSGPYRNAVDRSLITLKALTYQPTGGIVAAATTSLPEELSGVRNSIPGTAGFATPALHAAGPAGRRVPAQGQARGRDWLLRAIAGQPEMLQILYSIDGAGRLPEAELSWLSGYEGSSPVRTGNAASGQRQLDVWGETLDALFLARQGDLPRRPRRVDAAGRPDGLPRISLARTGQRIVGGARRPAALHPLQDHGLGRHRPDGAIGTRARSPGPVLRWEQLRDQIHHDVVSNAFDAGRNTFTQAYGSTALKDAEPAADPARRLPSRHGLPCDRHNQRGPPRTERRRPRQALSNHRDRRRHQRQRRPVHRLLILAGRRSARVRTATGRNRLVRAPAPAAQRPRAARARNGTRPHSASSATPPRRSATSP